MKSAKSTGRIVGMLLLIHLAAGLILPFVLLDRVRRPAGFLENAAGNSAQLRAAVFLLFVGSAVITEAVCGVVGIAYYRETKPAFSQAGRRTVEAVLAVPSVQIILATGSNNKLYNRLRGMPRLFALPFTLWVGLGRRRSGSEAGEPAPAAPATSRARSAWGWVILNSLAGPTLGVGCYQWALATQPSGVVLPIVSVLINGGTALLVLN